MSTTQTATQIPAAAPCHCCNTWANTNPDAFDALVPCAGCGGLTCGNCRDLDDVCALCDVLGDVVR